MKKEKTRWFGIPKLFPYLKGYGRLVLADMIALGFIGSAMDAVIPLFQQYAIDHFIADRTLAGLGAFVALYILVMIVQTATNCVSALAACKEKYSGVARKGVEAIELKMKGYETTEIAKLYGTSLNNVNAWISRARSKLRNEPILIEILC